MIKEIAKAISLIAVGLSLGWAYTERSWEPLIVFVCSVITYLSILGLEKKRFYNARIKITSHNNGDPVSGYVEIGGTYDKEPPSGYRIVIYNSSLDERHYWPQDEQVGLVRSQKRWRGSVCITGDTYVIIALAGPSGQALFDFYHRARKEVFSKVDEYPSIQNMAYDVQECDRVFLKHA